MLLVLLFATMSLVFQLSACVLKVGEKIKNTPCQAILEEYKACLGGAKAEEKNSACYKLMTHLEACSMKHLGKLDG